jgi:hypothetical protein
MTAYAKIGDVEVRLGESIPADLCDAVDKNLGEAAAYINLKLEQAHKNPESIDPDNLVSVNCNLTIRWYENFQNPIPEGAVSTSTSVGDFSQSVSFSRPTSTRCFWLSGTDRLLLGLRRKAGSYYMGADHD